MERIIKKEIDFEHVINFEDLVRNTKNIKKISWAKNKITDFSFINEDIPVLEEIISDIDNPFLLIDGELKINEEYFKKNKNKVMELIYFICKTTSEKKFCIYDIGLINDEVLKSINTNKNVDKVFLTMDVDDSNEFIFDEEKTELQYELNNNTYELFKKTSKTIYTPKISKELENNDDPLIGYNEIKPLINNLSYAELKNTTLFIFSKNLTNEEIDNFKYINQNNNISFSLKANLNVENIEKILDKITELNLDADINIHLNESNKETFNKSKIFLTNKYDDMNINLTILSPVKDHINLAKYKEVENLLYMFIEPIKNRNYSPFEKFIYAYNISKKFKQYKMGENDNEDFVSNSKSRSLYKILYNEYMVCTGFSSLFSDLLNKLGIESTVISFSEKQNGKEDFAEHARVFSHMQDTKYGIDGYYTSDPTWDNYLPIDIYTHLILTSNEVLEENIDIKSYINSPNNEHDYNFADDLFQVNAIQEFYNKINYIINFNIENYDKIKKNDFKPTENYKEKLKNVYEEIIKVILDRIKIIDSKKFNEITNKYNLTLENISSSINNVDNIDKWFAQIIEDLGEHICNKVNNPVSGETIIEAAMVINKDIFGFNEEQAKKYKETLIKANSITQNGRFPKTTIENISTGEITYQNEEVKFRL